MIELARTVRFCVNPLARRATAREGRPRNTFAAWPSMAGLGAYYELTVTCRGEPDPTTGYMMNITAIDAAVRDHAIGLIEQAAIDRPGVEPGALLRELIEALQPALERSVARVRWHLTPFYSVTMEADDMSRVLIRQQFEFAAAHRLHCPELSEAENRRTFGKCNNPNGHGHNYRLEVAVAAPVASDGSPGGFTVRELEAVVGETIVDRFDHTHLNMDCPEFQDLNPSVENIARVFHGLLEPAVARAGAELAAVTVWETEKTSSTYPAVPATFR